MIKSVCFLPRYVVEDLELNDQHAVISITDNGQKNANIKGTITSSNILRVNFLDIEKEIVHEKFQQDYLFDKNKAQKIVEFVTQLHTEKTLSHVRHIIVHCEAGVSRSAAVALFVHHFTNCQFKMLSQANLANRLAVKELADYSGINIFIPEKLQEEEIILIANKNNLF